MSIPKVTQILFLRQRLLTSDPPGQLNVLGHDGHSLGMHGTKVGVLEHSHKMSLGCLLQCQNCSALNPNVTFDVAQDFVNHPLKRWLLD